MGTKNNPGKFDCYAKALPDEPMFTLLGRDPQAAGLVRLWLSIKRGDAENALHVLSNIFIDAYLSDRRIDPDKAAEADNCAEEMENYFNSLT